MVNGAASNGVDYRQARGAALVMSKAKAFKTLAPDTYLVPSATASGSGSGYVVDIAAGKCTCPDFEERGLPCKHQWAVRYLRHELEMPDGSSIVTEILQAKRVSYPQNWRAYNRSQCEEKWRVQVLLRELCDGIVSAKRPRGRRPLPLGDVVYAATMKVYTGMSGRRATTEIRDCEEKGFVRRAPSYTSIFRVTERPDLTPLFKVLVEESAAPLKAVEREFAVDSTGFGTTTYGGWFHSKHGATKAHQWVKLHAAVGTRTHVVTAAQVTDGKDAGSGDSPEFIPLVTRTKANGFDVREVSGDKAYLSHENLAAVERIGAVPFIPLKSNSTSGKSAAWDRLFHYYSANRDDFLKRYHRRSNVETVFHAIKMKFGDKVDSRSFPAQVNEVLMKALCHNLSMVVRSICELNIEPKFWMPQNAGSTQDAGEVGTEFDLEVES
jgi:transposase